MEKELARIKEYLSTRHRPQNVNQKHNEQMGLQDRIALFVTAAVGTMYAVYFFALFMASWMLWQGYVDAKPFDP